MATPYIYEHIDWEQVFKKIDKDKDGLILKSDLKKFLLKHPLSDVPLHEDLVDAILYHVDFNNDGFVDMQEFSRLVNIQTDSRTRKAIRRALVKTALSATPRSQFSHSDRLYIEEYLCCPPPFIIILLCIIQIGVYVYYTVSQDMRVGPYTTTDLDSPLVFDPYRRQEAWRFITYMLMHAGYLHLFSNLFMQCILGIPLEMVHKWWRILILYMSGVIFGSIVASIFSPHAYLVGASGGCYALISAHLANIIINWKEMPFNWVRLIAFIGLVGLDFGLFVHATITQKDTNISYAAHLAGFIAGLLMGMITLRNLRKHRWEIVLKWMGFAVFMFLLAASIIIHIVSPDWVGFYPSKTSVAQAGIITTA